MWDLQTIIKKNTPEEVAKNQQYARKLNRAEFKEQNDSAEPTRVCIYKGTEARKGSRLLKTSIR
jgi:hypothetical protein